jgi:hypothetical protein
MSRKAMLSRVFVPLMLMLCACGWEPATATFADPSGKLNIQITRQRAHLFLPKFTHDISIDGSAESGGGWASSIAGFGNPTSSYRANLYRLDGPVLILCDFHDNYAIDRESAKRETSCRKGGLFVGSFDEDSTDQWVHICQGTGRVAASG